MPPESRKVLAKFKRKPEVKLLQLELLKVLETRNFCKYLSKASFSNLARSLFNFASNKTANLNVSIPERDWKLELVEHVL